MLTCSICRKFLIGSTKSTCSTPCRHIFHSKCLNRWYRRNHNCPHCHQDFSLTNIVRLFFSVESSDFANGKTSKNLLKQVVKLSKETQSKDQTIASLQVKNGKLKTENRKLEAQVKGLENQKRTNEKVTQGLYVKVKLLERECTDLSIKLSEAEPYKQRIESLKDILACPLQMTISVPNSKLEVVPIKETVQDCGTECVFKPRNESGKTRACHMRGTPEQLDCARSIISEKLALLPGTSTDETKDRMHCSVDWASFYALAGKIKEALVIESVKKNQAPAQSGQSLNRCKKQRTGGESGASVPPNRVHLAKTSEGCSHEDLVSEWIERHKAEYRFEEAEILESLKSNGIPSVDDDSLLLIAHHYRIADQVEAAEVLETLVRSRRCRYESFAYWAQRYRDEGNVEETKVLEDMLKSGG